MKTIITALFLGAIGYFVIAPWVFSNREIRQIHADAILAKAQEFADANSQGWLNHADVQQVTAQKAGDLNQAQQGQVLSRGGGIGNTDVNNYNRAILVLDGFLEGNTFVPATVPYDADQPSHHDLEKAVCDKGVTIETWGLVKASDDNVLLNSWSTIMGSRTPSDFKKFKKVDGTANFMELLIAADGQFFHDWQPVDQVAFDAWEGLPDNHPDKKKIGHNLHFQQFVQVDRPGCHPLGANVNDFSRDYTGLARNFTSNNSATEPRGGDRGGIEINVTQGEASASN